MSQSQRFHPDDEIDERTVAERQGRAIDPVTGQRPAPPGWPLEALAFPFRGAGPTSVAGTALLLVGLDLVLRWNVFAGLLGLVTVIPFLLRWQVFTASRSAAGLDAPEGWARAMELDTEQIVGMARLLPAAGLLGLALSFVPGTTRYGLVLPAVAVTTLWLAGGVLGESVSDRRRLRAVYALGWGLQRPLAVLAGCLAWWGAAAAEAGVLALRELPWGSYLASTLGLRLATMWLWLVSARALGIVGRTWTP